MKDLYRCLDEYPPQMLRAIADAWQVPLPDGDAKSAMAHLAQEMLRPAALLAVIERLTPEARGALAEFAEQNGVAPGQRLALRFGGIRRLGPVRMERERPWQEPANALEELYYSGLIYRTYGPIDGRPSEIFVVPQQLLEGLPDLRMTMPPFQIETVAAPVRATSDGQALLEDLLAALVHIRQGRYPVTVGAEHDFAPVLIERLGVVKRLVGANLPERMALVQRLLWRLRLLYNQRGCWQPSLRAREWLRLSDAKRCQSVFAAWRDDPQWDELRWLPSLRCEETGWRNQPVVGRRNLLQVLGKCPPDQWFSLDSFLLALRRYRPDYLRPDGDLNSWFIRDAHTNEYLRGLAAWDQIEGALARHIITASLHWLGCVELGYTADANQPFAFRLTNWGLAALTGQEMPADTAPALPALATIRDDYTVSIPLAETMYWRYQLERFAEWQSQDRIAIYRLSAETIWQSHNAGIKTDQVLGFLKRVSGDQVAPNVLRSLHAWGGRFGRVMLRRMVLLQAVDERTMKQISARSELRALVYQVLSPTSCLVDAERLDELIESLKELGIWPHLKP